jgi:hypothetical protein
MLKIRASELDGPGSVALVALDEGQGLKKPSGFIWAFLEIVYFTIGSSRCTK